MTCVWAEPFDRSEPGSGTELHQEVVLSLRNCVFQTHPVRATVSIDVDHPNPARGLDLPHLSGLRINAGPGRVCRESRPCILLHDKVDGVLASQPVLVIHHPVRTAITSYVHKPGVRRIDCGPTLIVDISLAGGWSPIVVGRKCTVAIVPLDPEIVPGTQSVHADAIGQTIAVDVHEVRDHRPVGCVIARHDLPAGEIDVRNVHTSPGGCRLLKRQGFFLIFKSLRGKRNRRAAVQGITVDSQAFQQGSLG